MTITRGMGPGKGSQISEKGETASGRKMCPCEIKEDRAQREWEVHRCHCAPVVCCTGC